SVSSREPHLELCSLQRTLLKLFDCRAAKSNKRFQDPDTAATVRDFRGFLAQEAQWRDRAAPARPAAAPPRTSNRTGRQGLGWGRAWLRDPVAATSCPGSARAARFCFRNTERRASSTHRLSAARTRGSSASSSSPSAKELHPALHEDSEAAGLCGAANARCP